MGDSWLHFHQFPINQFVAAIVAVALNKVCDGNELWCSLIAVSFKRFVYRYSTVAADLKALFGNFTMMLSSLATLSITMLILSATPGPSDFAVVARSLSFGFRQGLIMT